MANKALVSVIVALSLVVLGLIGYFVILPAVSQNSSNPGGSSGGNQATNRLTITPDFNGNITGASFQDFPAGMQITPSATGTITNIFHKSDQMEINGTSDVDRQVNLTIKVFDLNGNDMGIIWHGNPITIRSGSFSFGVLSVPQNSGDYVLEIYLDGYASYSMPFQVI